MHVCSLHIATQVICEWHLKDKLLLRSETGRHCCSYLEINAFSSATSSTTLIHHFLQRFTALGSKWWWIVVLTALIRTGRWAAISLTKCATQANFSWLSVVLVETWKCWLWRDQTTMSMSLVSNGLMSNGRVMEVACHQFHGNNNMMLIWLLILTFHLDDLDSTHRALILLLGKFFRGRWLLWLNMISVNRLAYGLGLVLHQTLQLCHLVLLKSRIMVPLLWMDLLILILIQIVLSCCRHQWRWALTSHDPWSYTLSMLVNRERLIIFQRPYLVDSLKFWLLFSFPDRTSPIMCLMLFWTHSYIANEPIIIEIQLFEFLELIVGLAAAFMLQTLAELIGKSLLTGAQHDTWQKRPKRLFESLFLIDLRLYNC